MLLNKNSINVVSILYFHVTLNCLCVLLLKNDVKVGTYILLVVVGV